MRLMDAGRGRKGPFDGRTLGLSETWEQVEDGNDGKPDRGRQARLSRGTPFGRSTWEGITDEWWRRAGGSAIQVVSCSATGRERGEEEAGENIERSGVGR